MSSVSASGLGRLFRCLGPAVLPNVGNENKWADAGMESEAAILADDDRLEAILRRVGLWSDGAVWEKKVAFAYDTKTGKVRRLPGSEDRAARYGDVNRDVEIPGELDLLGFLPDRVIAPDLKAGQPSNLPAAKDSKQLAFYGMVAAKFHGVDKATVAHVFTKDEGEEWADIAPTLDVWDFDSFATDLRLLMERIRAANVLYDGGKGSPPEVRTGKHCSFCPALLKCDAHTSLVKVAYEAPDKLAEVVGDLLRTNPAGAWEAVQSMYRAKKKFNEQIDSVIATVAGPVYAHVREQGIELPGGKWLREVEKKGSREIHAKVALPVLAGIYGQEVANAALEEAELTQAAIKRAVKAAGMKADMDATMSALDAAGAVTRKKASTEIVERDA